MTVIAAVKYLICHGPRKRHPVNTFAIGGYWIIRMRG
jgi:hypothetical protein